MSVGDVFFLRTNFTTNNRAWGFGMYAEELSPQVPQDDGGPIARAWRTRIEAQVKLIITTESVFQSVQAWRRHPQASRPGFDLVDAGNGGRPGDSLPNDNALFINLRQIATDAKHNGGVYIAGQSDSDHADSKWNTGYLNIQVAAFAILFQDLFNAVGADSGQWRPVVLSKTFTPQALPIGTTFDITQALASDRVQSQRRRGQKSKGYALSTM